MSWQGSRARSPQVQIRIAVTGNRAGRLRPGGRTDNAAIRMVAPEVTQRMPFVCGPKGMIDAMRTLLLSMGVPANRIRSELFEAAVAASSRLPERDETRSTLLWPGRAGVCGTCRVRALEGHIHCASTILDDRDRPERFVLARASFARSDDAIEA